MVCSAKRVLTPDRKKVFFAATLYYSQRSCPDSAIAEGSHVILDPLLTAFRSSFLITKLRFIISFGLAIKDSTRLSAHSQHFGQILRAVSTSSIFQKWNFIGFNYCWFLFSSWATAALTSLILQLLMHHLLLIVVKVRFRW